MSTEHILSAFDHDLERIQALMLRMGGLVETALHDAMTALERGDLELATKVREGDGAIDALEEDIRQEVERLIALRAPAATDLRQVLSILTMASTLERCGDYARNVAKRTFVLEEFRYASTLNGTLRRMSRVVEVMLADALDWSPQAILDQAEELDYPELELLTRQLNERLEAEYEKEGVRIAVILQPTVGGKPVAPGFRQGPPCLGHHADQPT